MGILTFLKIKICVLWIFNWFQNDVSIIENLAPHPRMLIAKDNLIKSLFFGHKHNLNQLLWWLNDFQWEYFFQILCWMLNYLIVFPFILNFVLTVIFRSEKTELYIICFRLEHYTDYWPWGIYFDYDWIFLTCTYFLSFHESGEKA